MLVRNGIHAIEEIMNFGKWFGHVFETRANKISSKIFPWQKWPRQGKVPLQTENKLTTFWHEIRNPMNNRNKFILKYVLVTFTFLFCCCLLLFCWMLFPCLGKKMNYNPDLWFNFFFPVFGTNAKDEERHTWTSLDSWAIDINCGWEPTTWLKIETKCVSSK